MAAVQERYLARFRDGEVGCWEALSEACLKGWPAVAEAVLVARPELVHLEHNSKLQRALSHLYFRGDSQGRAEVIRVLIAAGLDATRPGMAAGGPLMLTAWLDGGAPVDGTGPADRLLHGMIEGRSSPDAALLLIERGADVNALDADGRTPLMIAARCGNIQVARALLDRDCDTLAVDAGGRTAMRYAVEAATGGNLYATPGAARQARTIARLLADLPPGQPEDAVLALLLKDDDEALSAWLASGLPAGESLPGAAAVHFGAQFTPQQRLGFFLRSMGLSVERAAGIVKVEDPGVDLDVAAGSSSLLYWSVALNAPRCARALLAKGADPDRSNGLGSTPRTLAKALRRNSLIELLEGKPAKVLDDGSRAGRMGIDSQKLRDELKRDVEVFSKQDPYWDEFKATHGYTPSDAQFAGQIVRGAYVLEDSAMVETYARFVLVAAQGELSPRRLEEADPADSWYHLARPVLHGLMAAALLGQLDDFLKRLAGLPKVPAPTANSYVSIEAEEHAAWLCVLLAANQAPAEADVRRVRAGRSIRPKRLLDLFLSVRNKDATSAAAVTRELLKLHRKANKELVAERAYQLINAELSAMLCAARHAGVEVQLDTSDLDYLILPPGEAPAP